MSKLALIGCGHIGHCLLNGLLNSSSYQIQDLLVVEHSKQNCQTLQQAYPKLQAISPVDERLSTADMVLLCVKPKDSYSACQAIAPYLKPNGVLISVVAGLTIGTLKKYLGKYPGGSVGGEISIVRGMPNIAAAVGESMTAWYAPQLSVQQKQVVTEISQAIGQSLWLDEEAMVDTVTALAGSGPAYFFYFIEALISAGLSEGLSQEQAAALIQQTAKGAVCYLEQEQISAEQARLRVSSPKGTTEQAIAVLTKHKLSEAVDSAVRAAKQRALDISNDLDQA